MFWFVRISSNSNKEGFYTAKHKGKSIMKHRSNEALCIHFCSPLLHAWSSDDFTCHSTRPRLTNYIAMLSINGQRGKQDLTTVQQHLLNLFRSNHFDLFVASLLAIQLTYHCHPRDNFNALSRNLGRLTLPDCTGRYWHHRSTIASEPGWCMFNAQPVSLKAVSCGFAKYNEVLCFVVFCKFLTS